jgi:7-keto-8-aminopelargonate synthetase-like enzyme
LPLILGGEQAAVAAAGALREQGIYLPAIRYPTVARNQARLRLTLSAAHNPADIRLLLKALKSL